ncbi:hypothetical protein [Leptospira interrogans]|uniref:hypothetical protein n=1 Tax=Leptospira interrogans TaxID=173 RepID=UPI0002786233|nr:hypothetical protein [Leptospira interrogans]EJP15406.1 hypothetical protein LEP1GSC080_0067 [Leptospira interrogans str. FPW2026]WOT10921.1 hypothetical protein CFY92_0018370 [Leptospira interrogans]WOT10939.1 hypothetical protein CFY92_0018465 [Leptospira interrogans]
MKEKQAFPSGNIQYRSVLNLNKSISFARGYLLSPLHPSVSAGVVFRKDSKDQVFKFRGSKERSAMYEWRVRAFLSL